MGVISYFDIRFGYTLPKSHIWEMHYYGLLCSTNRCGGEYRYVFVGFAYQGKDIVFKFIIEYSSLRDFGP
jgi:hypothetical protein